MDVDIDLDIEFVPLEGDLAHRAYDLALESLARLVLEALEELQEVAEEEQPAAGNLVSA